MKKGTVLLITLIFSINFCLIFASNNYYNYKFPQISPNSQSFINSQDSNLKIHIDKALLDSFNTIKVIVTFKEGIDTQSQLKILENQFNIKEIHEFHVFSGANFEIQANLINDLAKFEGISGIYQNRKIQFVDTNAPQIYSTNIDLEESANLIDARGLPYTGKGVNIAIIDTGIYSNHYDLMGKVVKKVSFVNSTYGWNLDEAEGTEDEMGHGTHCAGIAAGTGAGSVGLSINCTGIAPGASLFNGKCLDKVGGGYEASVAAAIEWAIENGANIISLSLGFEPLNLGSPVMMAVANATASGIIVVVAAGNSGPWFSSVKSPGDHPSIITVGASNGDDKVTNFSSRGPSNQNFADPDVVAPGEHIIAALAPGSVIEAIWQKEGETIYRSPNAEYAALSGTSMATPTVAGGIALLKEAFPNLSPEAARIALMESADSIVDGDSNIQGAGRINITRSFYFLNSTPEWNVTGMFNITSIFPKSLPTPPFDSVKFPGDFKETNLLILKSYPVPLKMNVTGNASDFIQLSPNNLTTETAVDSKTIYIFENTNLSIIKMDIYIPLSTKPAFYSGQVEIYDNNTGGSLKNATLAFNISIPIGRIYFDNFHNYDNADSFTENYHALVAYLYNCNYAVDTGKELLSYNKLKNYDILLLPDIEIMFTSNEIEEIKRFWEDGGSILILGSSYPNFAEESLNDLLQNLGVGINYSIDNIERKFDYGLGSDVALLNITDLKTHPITEGINSFSWVVGRDLEVDTNKSIILADYMGFHVMAANSTSRGSKIVVIGAERHMYDDLFFENDNQRLIYQTFEWLLNDSRRSDQKNLSVQVIANSSFVNLDSSNETEFGIYIWNKTSNTCIDGLTPGIDLNATLKWFNGTGWNIVWEADSSNVTTIGNGAYNFTYIISEEGLYNLSVLVKNNPEFGYGETAFKAIKNSPTITAVYITEIHSDPFLTYSDYEYDVYRNGDKLTINATIGIKTGILEDDVNVTLYLTSVEPFNRNIKYLIFPMQNYSTLESNEANFSVTITPDHSFPANKYAFFILTNNTQGYFDYYQRPYSFIINDNPPIIYEYLTLLGNTRFSTGLYYETFWGDNIPISISGYDEEDNTSQMDAFFMILNTIQIGNVLFSYNVVLAQKINYSSFGNFQSTINIPINGYSNVLDNSYFLGDYYYIAFAMLRDSDGGWDENSYTYILFIIKTPLHLLWDYYTNYYQEPRNPTLLISLLTVIGVAVGITLTYFLLKRKKTEYLPLKELKEGREDTMDNVIRDILREKEKSDKKD